MQKNSNGLKSINSRLIEFFSFKDVFSLRKVVIMGMMVAISVVFNQFEIFLADFKLISFAYLPGVVVAMLFGPWAALVYGFVNDTVSFLINSHGLPYFFGYAISEMLTYFFYACLLYKRPVKIWRVAAARALFIIFIVFGLNFIWLSITYGTAPGKYFTSLRLINNFVQYPFHVVLTTLVGKYITKIQAFRTIPLE